MHRASPALRYWALSLAAYSVYVVYTLQNGWKLRLHAMDELYSISSMCLGLLFGCFSAHYMSQWWSLRLATGSVGGAIADIAMIVKGYFHQVDDNVPEQLRQSIGSNLKRAHLYHLCEAFGVPSPANWVSAVLSGSEICPQSLIATLSAILADVTQLTTQMQVSDPVKFALLPAVQGDLSTIRSGSGDCVMILKTPYSKVFTSFVLFLGSIHLLYLPVYIGSRTGWEPYPVLTCASLGFTLIAGFALIVMFEFRNPFVVNAFGFSRLLQGTFDIVDECIGGQQVEEFQLGSPSKKSAQPVEVAETPRADNEKKPVQSAGLEVLENPREVEKKTPHTRRKSKK